MHNSKEMDYQQRIISHLVKNNHNNYLLGPVKDTSSFINGDSTIRHSTKKINYQQDLIFHQDPNNQNTRQNHVLIEPMKDAFSLDTEDDAKCPAFLRYVFGNVGSWKWHDAHTQGFQSLHELHIRFQPFQIGIKYRGYTITHVLPGSQADIAGVREKWTILAINGKKISDISHVIKSSIDETNQHDQMTNILFTKKTIKNVKTITFKSQWIGISYIGNCITKVEQFSQAYHAGVTKDWIIIKINNQLMPVDTHTIHSAIEQASLRGNIIQITFQIPDKPINLNCSKYSPQNDPDILIPSMINKVKSRVMKKYVVK